jgi:hypothetical protein
MFPRNQARTQTNTKKKLKIYQQVAEQIFRHSI